MSSGPPPQRFYASDGATTGSSAAAQPTYQPYRPQSQQPAPEAPSQQDSAAPAGGYRPYNPQAAHSQQHAPAYELPGNGQPAVPAITIEEPTPATSVASHHFPSPPPSHQTSGDDDLYDAPPPQPVTPYPQHPVAVAESSIEGREEAPQIPPKSTARLSGSHEQPPSYHQSEGVSSAYPNYDEKIAHENASDKLTHEIGNMLLSEGSTSNADTKGRNEDLPPQYHGPEGSSLSYQPAQEGKSAIPAAVPLATPSSPPLAHGDSLPQYNRPDSSAPGPAHDDEDIPPPLPGPRPFNNGIPPQYYEPEGVSLESQPMEQGKPHDGTFYPPPPPGPPPSRYDNISPVIQASTSHQKPPPLPPRPTVTVQHFGEDDPSNPVHYTRDPHKLIAYLIPFPKPMIKGQPISSIPDRFLIYTPPPPPLSKPAEGEKEARFHKIQRKWQEEVRSAKTSTAKTASWQGVKSKATKGIDWAMSQTVSSNLEFLNRMDGNRSRSPSPGRPTSPSNKPPAQLGGGPTSPGLPSPNTSTEQPPTPPPPAAEHKIKLEELILIYPSSIPGTQQDLREELVNTMLRSKSKAQRDAVIATGLLPVTFAIDLLATVIWPFGGLLEIDSVWAYSSIRGARVARSTTKRLSASEETSKKKSEDDKLKLTFTPSARLTVLQRYLAATCHERSHHRFASPGTFPTETEVLEAIGWAPSQTDGETKNWEDEQWETTEVKEDFKSVIKKGAREWENWCKEFEKDPKKALKK